MTIAKHAICNYCDQEMKEGVACTLDIYNDFSDGEVRERLPNDSGTMCHDCNAPDGGLHHPGCDAERCPGCGEQAISCECDVEGEWDEDY